MPREHISDRVRKLGFPLGQYVVVGGVMEAHGIRDANDLDIVVTPELFAELVSHGWKICECEKCERLKQKGFFRPMLKGDGVDILSDYSWENVYSVDVYDLIKRAEFIQDIPYASLEELMNWKKAAARPKDLKDIKLIESYLGKKSI